MRVENGKFVFDGLDGETKGIDPERFKQIDIFMPQLNQVQYTSPSELFGSTPHINSAKDKEMARRNTITYITSKPELLNSALRHYNETLGGNYTRQDLEDEAIAEAVLSTFADEVADQWQAPRKPSSSGGSGGSNKPISFMGATSMGEGINASISVLPKSVTATGAKVSGVVRTDSGGWFLYTEFEGVPTLFAYDGSVNDPAFKNVSGLIVKEAPPGMISTFDQGLANVFKYPSSDSAKDALFNAFGSATAAPQSSASPETVDEIFNVESN